MHPKVSNVITAVVTAGILGGFGWAAGVFSEGSKAIDKEQIRAVLVEELMTDAGKTYKARLAEVGGKVLVLETRVDGLTADVDGLEDDVDGLEDDVLDLAGGS